MTLRQRIALDYLKRARAADRQFGQHGVVTSEKSFYDIEIDLAYIHWRTAKALAHMGLIEYGDWDPEWGTEIRLKAANDHD